MKIALGGCPISKVGYGYGLVPSEFSCPCSPDGMKRLGPHRDGYGHDIDSLRELDFQFRSPSNRARKS